MINKQKKTFTLIEMLIVIVIIGILAAAVIPRLTQMQARARNTARKASMSQIITAIYAYAVNNGMYPWTLWTLVSWGYMTTVPADPQVSTNNPCGSHPNAAFYDNRNWFFTGYASCVADNTASSNCIGYKWFIYTHGWALSHGATLVAYMENDGSNNAQGYQWVCAWVDYSNWWGVWWLSNLQAIKAATLLPLSTKGSWYHQRIEYQ